MPQKNFSQTEKGPPQEGTSAALALVHVRVEQTHAAEAVRISISIAAEK